MGDDLYILLNILYHASKIIYLDQSFYLYRINSSSLTVSPSFDKMYDRALVFDRLLFYFNKLGMDSETIIQKTSQLFIQLTLKFVYKNGYANLPFTDKRNTIIKIQNLDFYRFSKKHASIFKLNNMEKILFFLFEKKQIFLITLLSKISYFLKNFSK